MFNRNYKYSQWDGTQQIFDPTGEDIMDELSEGLLNDSDVSRALRNLLQRGMQNDQGQRIQGLQEMLERIRGQRQARMEKYNLDSVMDDIKNKLDQVISQERKGIDQRLQEAREQAATQRPEIPIDTESLLKLLEERANRNRDALDNLPENTSGAIKELSDYDFIDPDARDQFKELMDILKQRMIENTFQDVQQQFQNIRPQDVENTRDMLRNLNEMLTDKLRGLEPDFDSFMDKYGDMFGPDSPSNIDELINQLQQQMSQAQSLMNSMSPEMRQEMSDLMTSAMDEETLGEMSQLMENIGQLTYPDDLASQYPFIGDDSITWQEALKLMEELQNLDSLENDIREASRTGTIDDLDPNKIDQILGEQTRMNLEQLQDLAKRLIDAGYAIRKGNKLELTPLGIRKIGQKAMRDVFSRISKGRIGTHEIHSRGSLGEHSGETKPYEFGDPFDINLESTLKNALMRSGGGSPVKLSPEDFEINRTEHITQASTVLLIDQSRSMGLYGSFTAAKKVAMALSSLIRTKYPRDRFYIVGFSDYAIEIKENDLHQISWNDWVSGTNMHHAFMLSRALLRKDKGSTRQIIMITDGEPTTHIEANRAYFSYPPSYRTIQETLREVRRCTQEGITINTFMLENSAYLMDFVDKMMRINNGRAFYSKPQSLGEYVLVDYVSNRKRRIS